jgi:Ser/Thr protein kinase RdoA (MazF antagonist)
LLQRLAQKIGNEEIIVTGRHGDFGPWNVLARPDCVTVVDFFGYQDDPPVMDVMNMLLALEHERRSLTASPARALALRRSFLEGYGEIPDVQESVLLMCEVFQRICGVHDGLNQGQGRLHRRWQKHRSLSANIRWLTGNRRDRLLRA